MGELQGEVYMLIHNDVLEEGESQIYDIIYILGFHKKEDHFRDKYHFKKKMKCKQSTQHEGRDIDTVTEEELIIILYGLNIY